MSKSVILDDEIDTSKLKSRNDFENKLKELNTEYVKYCEIVRENNEKRKEVLNTMVKINDLFKQTIEDKDIKDSEEDLDEKLMSTQKKASKKVKATNKKVKETNKKENVALNEPDESNEPDETVESEELQEKPKVAKKKPVKKLKTKKKKGDDE